MGIEIKIPEARMSFEVLGEAKPYQGNPANKARWSCVWLVPADSAIKKQIDVAIEKMGLEKWGKKWPSIKAQITTNSQKMCWQDGAMKADDYEGYAGHWALSTHRYAEKGAPIVMDNDTSPIYDMVSRAFYPGKAGRLYGGCYIRGTVELYTYDTPAPGIAGSFSVIQRLRKGDAFGGGKPADATGYEAVDDGADDAAMGGEQTATADDGDLG